MFTGLIETTGRIARVQARDGGHVMRVDAAFAAELHPGDSVSVNGVCLTVTTHDDTGFAVDVSPETLRASTLGTFAEGRLVNLERPLRADARLGGHFVLGHVDDTGRIERFDRDGDAYWLDVAFAKRFAPYLIPKGSVAVDGISLTVASLAPDRFGIQVIPFTREHTSLRAASVGDVVNLEADVLGKYVVRIHALQDRPIEPGA